MFVAVEGERIVGYITVSVAEQAPYGQVNRVGHISELMVTASHRRQGIGARLMAGARAVFERQGVRCTTAYTVDRNLAGRRFYARCGLAPLGVTLLGDPAPPAADGPMP